jgi:hypothetical protein
VSPPRFALHRWLPPLLVLGGLAYFLWTVLAAGGRSRAREEAHLRARIAETADPVAVAREIDDFLTRHTADADARWFAVDLHARRLDVRSALAAFEGDPAVRDAPGAARRFAAIVLRWLGDRPAEGPPRSWLFSHALLARLDGGDPEATRTLDDLVAAIAPNELVNSYLPAHRVPTRGAMAMATAWMRRASEREFLVASSAIRARPGDLAIAQALRPIVESSWRTERPLLWNNGARALGTLGDPDSVAALRRERALALGDDLDEERRRLVCDAGLAVAGDADAWKRVLRAVDDPRHDWVGVQAALGLDARRIAGDATARAAMVELWGRLAVRAEGGVRTGRVLAHAWALRRRQPEATAALLADLREVLAGRDVVARTEGPEEDEGSAVVEALRALVRWG